MERTEIMTEWADALESGEYEQGRSYLRTGDNAFCCLGVLCEIAVKHGVIRPGARAWGTTYHYGRGGYGSVLPDEVRAWAGVSSEGTLVDDLTELTGLNDSGTPFTEIAAIIRQGRVREYAPEDDE